MCHFTLAFDPLSVLGVREVWKTIGKRPHRSTSLKRRQAGKLPNVARPISRTVFCTLLGLSTPWPGLDHLQVRELSSSASTTFMTALERDFATSDINPSNLVYQPFNPDRSEIRLIEITSIEDGRV